MLISVIIPAYNSADTIVEALESVAAQTVLGRNAGPQDPTSPTPFAEASEVERLRRAGNGTTQPSPPWPAIAPKERRRLSPIATAGNAGQPRDPSFAQELRRTGERGAGRTTEVLSKVL